MIKATQNYYVFSKVTRIFYFGEIMHFVRGFSRLLIPLGRFYQGKVIEGNCG